MNNNHEVTSYDDPIFKEMDDFFNQTTSEVMDKLPDKHIISKDDEWNDPSYDESYKKFCETHGGANET